MKTLLRLFTIFSLVLIAIPSHSEVKGKKILYVDSYHEGYAWSDGITNGIRRTLEGTGVDLKVMRMNTKRKADEASIKAVVAEVKQAIDTDKPDLVIVSDDNATKHILSSTYKNAKLPFVFCGVNWDASIYGLPYDNATGMEEVDGVKELLDLLKQMAKGTRVAMLSDDTETSHSNAKNYHDKLGISLIPVYVKTFAEWQQKFAELQSTADILLIQNVSGIMDFDSKIAQEYVLGHAKIPSGAVQIDMMPYAMVGYLKVAEEQGVWSTKAALEILNGKSPKAIPITQNKEGQIYVNFKVASATGLEVPYTIVEVASQVMQ